MKIYEDYDLTFSDVDVLPESSFLHINSVTLSRSWLDHVLSSYTVNASTSEILIDYNYCASDHLPLMVTLNFNSLPLCNNDNAPHK